MVTCCWCSRQSQPLPPAAAAVAAVLGAIVHSAGARCISTRALCCFMVLSIASNARLEQARPGSNRCGHHCKETITAAQLRTHVASTMHVKAVYQYVEISIIAALFRGLLQGG